MFPSVSCSVNYNEEIYDVTERCYAYFEGGYRPFLEFYDHGNSRVVDIDSDAAWERAKQLMAAKSVMTVRVKDFPLVLSNVEFDLIVDALNKTFMQGGLSVAQAKATIAVYEKLTGVRGKFNDFSDKINKHYRKEIGYDDCDESETKEKTSCGVSENVSKIQKNTREAERA